MMARVKEPSASETNERRLKFRQARAKPGYVITRHVGTAVSGAEALGALGGGALATVAGIRAPMLAGAVPIAVGVAVLAWRHRAAPAA